MIVFLLLGLLGGFLNAVVISPTHPSGHGATASTAARTRAPAQLPIRGPLAGFSTTPTTVFDASGRLWTVFVEGPRVYVTSSRDDGRTFASAVAVNPAPEDVDANGESRPKIAVGPQGQVYVSYTRKLDKPYTGEIRFSHSSDGGRTFAPPMTVNDDGLATGHRFDALGVNGRGDVYLAWIDKRDVERAEEKKIAYEGGALYYALSADGGRTFSVNRKLKDNVCECCRLALAFDAQGLPVLFWRDILLGGVRDHSLAGFTGRISSGVVRRASFDGWAINACPHHGPALAVDDRGTFHLAWFTGAGPNGPGSFYARSADRGKSYSKTTRIGSEDAIGRPCLVTSGASVFLAWKEALRPEGTAIRVATSADHGEQWTPPRELSRTRGDSDHPFLLIKGGTAYFSWFTAQEGYRLIPVP